MYPHSDYKPPKQRTELLNRDREVPPPPGRSIRIRDLGRVVWFGSMNQKKLDLKIFKGKHLQADSVETRAITSSVQRVGGQIRQGAREFISFGISRLRVLRL